MSRHLWYKGDMSKHRLPIPETFPPYVVGSVSDVETWRALDGDVKVPCDVVELRVDAFPAGIGAGVFAQARCERPVLVTVRHESEGGLRPMREVERETLASYLLPIASALDWEIARMHEATDLLLAAKEDGVTLIASAHDFHKTPSLAELREKEQFARSMGADIVKFAFRLNSYEDIQVGIDLLRGATGPMAVMGMGPLGAASRLLYAQHGSKLVYGYLGETPTAPGQWSAELCLNALGSLTPVE